MDFVGRILKDKGSKRDKSVERDAVMEARVTQLEECMSEHQEALEEFGTVADMVAVLDEAVLGAIWGDVNNIRNEVLEPIRGEV